MHRNTYKLSSDLKGLNSITTDTVSSITDIVEALHYKIISFGGILGANKNNRTSGITGMIYRIIRGITKLAGGGIDIALEPISRVLEKKESSPQREAVISALNGVIGDYLVARNNPFAVSMQFRRSGESIDILALSEELQQAGSKLVIMMHGLCMNDLQWSRQGHNHGTALFADLGYIPIYIRYNSGLHISENGREFSELLEMLIQQLPQSTELYIVAHSMGGLVSRSACELAKNTKHSWLNHLKKIIFLGTPHHGAPLEKGGNWIDNILELNPYSKPFSRLGKIRSSGITDMRYGYITDKDWKGQDRFQFSEIQRISIPLPEKVQCYAIAASTGKKSNKLNDNLIGDGLVPVNSALGQHKNTDLKLNFPKTHQYIIRNINHLELLNNSKVYEILKKYLT